MLKTTTRATALLLALTGGFSAVSLTSAEAAKATPSPTLSVTCGALSSDVVGEGANWNVPDSAADGPISVTIGSAKGLVLQHIFVGHDIVSNWWLTTSPIGGGDILGVSSTGNTTLLNASDGSFTPRLGTTQTYRGWVPNSGYVSGDVYRVVVGFKKTTVEVTAYCTAP